MKNSIIRIAIGCLTFILGILITDDFTIKLIAFIVAYLILGVDVIMKAIKNIIKGRLFDENLLMTIATLGAFILGEYPEGIAVMLFYQIGEMFSDFAVDKSRKSIKKLLDIRPDYANLIIKDKIEKTSPENLNPGDIILIKPGERIPIDGKVKDGNSTVDVSALTGESVPLDVKSGDKILSGCINLTGTLIAIVETSYNQSTVSRILDLVESANEKKAQTEKFITKFAKYYTPAVIITAIAIAIVPPVLLPENYFNEWFYRALVFLVVSCPCALVISIPLSFFCGIGLASKKGILIKGSNSIEVLSIVDTIVFDKTGTLTNGRFSIVKILPIGIDKEKFLEMASHAEIHSSHPIADSIKRLYDKDLNESRVKSLENLSGYGIKANVDDKIVYIGNSNLMKSINIDYYTPSNAGSVVHMAIDGKYCGYIVVADKIKSDAIVGIKCLYDMGIKKIAMLTGDSKVVGESVANDLGLDYFAAELLPEDKVKEIENMKKDSKNDLSVAFVGDGINDAPVLAVSDVGIAMGGVGSDATIETADVVIMDDKPSKVVDAISISDFTMKTVKQNIVFSLGVKFAILILGFLGLSTMWEAVFADVGVSAIAILNSLRLLKRK